MEAMAVGGRFPVRVRRVKNLSKGIFGKNRVIGGGKNMVLT